MQLLGLRLHLFRNFREQEIAFCRGANLFFGRNGQGKTNLLEAIYFLGYGRSFRTASAKECIQFGQQGGRVEGTAAHGGLQRRLAVTLFPSEKRLYLHGKPARVDEFTGMLPVMAFTQEHLKVVRGSPADRRAFLDRAITGIQPSHLRSLASFGRALKQRNTLLCAIRDGRESVDRTALESWDEKVIVEGARIMRNRAEYVGEMRRKIPRGMFGREEFELAYAPCASGGGREEEFAALLRKGLAKARRRDERSGHTSVGPHRDELEILVDGRALAAFGSAGQQRSCLLSLYIAQLELHRERHTYYPVFLMDDVETELDQARMMTFLEYIVPRTQTMLTTTRDLFTGGFDAESRRFEIRNGTVADEFDREMRQDGPTGSPTGS